jgi:hypothetical protein
VRVKEREREREEVVGDECGENEKLSFLITFPCYFSQPWQQQPSFRIRKILFISKIHFLVVKCKIAIIFIPPS